MRRLWTLLLAALLLAWSLPGIPARAEEPEMRIDVSGGEVLPGQAAIVSFTVPEDGACTIVLTDGDGKTAAVVAENRPVTAGYNSLYWNGTWQGLAVPEGEWILRLEMNGRTAETAVTVGRMLPYLISAVPDRDRVTVGKRITVACYATEAGLLRLTVGGEELAAAETAAGEGGLAFDAALAPGDYTAEMTLEREDGTVSPPARFSFTVEKPSTGFPPKRA